MRTILLSLLGLACYTLSWSQAKTDPSTNQVYVYLPENTYRVEVAKPATEKGQPASLRIVLNPDHSLFDGKDMELIQNLPFTLELSGTGAETFSDGKTKDVHKGGMGRIQANGSVTVNAQVANYAPRRTRVRIRIWDEILQEGACSVALLSVAAGCSSQGLDPISRKQCICGGIRNLVGGGAAACYGAGGVTGGASIYSSWEARYCR